MLAYAGVQLADVQSKQLVAMAYRKLINVKSFTKFEEYRSVYWREAKKQSVIFFEGIPQ